MNKYKKFTLCYDLMYTNCIGLLNAISKHNMFATRSMIENRKINNIEDGIKQVNNVYLHRCFKITSVQANRESELLRAEMADLGISLNCESRKKISLGLNN